MKVQLHSLRMTLTALTIVSVPLLVGAANASLSGREGVRAELQVALARIGPVPMNCATQCEYTPCFNQDHHKNQTHSGGTNTGTTHGCQFTENGCEGHKCQTLFGEADVDLKRVETLLRTIDGRDLRSLATADGALRINYDRRAAQLVGCGDRVALSINLTEAQLASLTSD